ncbi:kinase inhibitor [Orbaceae bacterium ESL0721]|nr:kinase inhibitor [Orbaceae bacterium ESL0721]
MKPFIKISMITALLTASLNTFAADKFSVSSNDMDNKKPLSNQQVFNSFGCTGGNLSPELHWENAPKGTKSFAVTVYDPDAPSGSGWWHWTVVNIPATVNQLPAGAGDKEGQKLPAGAVQGRNDYGYAGFGGACPPEGDKPHRYQFTVWALNSDNLPLDNESSGALVGYMLNNSVIEKTELTVNFGR